MKNRKNIITVGGGTGTPIVNDALIKAGIKDIVSIVTVMDSGGITGRRRIDSYGQEIALSDALRTMLSLVNPKIQNQRNTKALLELLRTRSPQKHLGYEIFSHYADHDSGFSRMQQLIENLLGKPLLGKVLPVTNESTNIIFTTELGRTYSGEHELDDKRMAADRVVEMHLQPKVKATEEAMTEINGAKFIFLCFGSLHGSTLANFLVRGIPEAYKKSNAKKILITNLVSTRNESHDFTLTDFINLTAKYTGTKHPLDYLVVPNMSRGFFEKKYPAVAKHYQAESSHFLGWDEKEMKMTEKKFGLKIITHDATMITEAAENHLVVRHDPGKLAKALKKIL